MVFLGQSLVYSCTVQFRHRMVCDLFETSGEDQGDHSWETSYGKQF